MTKDNNFSTNQTHVTLNQQTIEQIRQETQQPWRECKRQTYNVFACKVPAGYVFANKLEQPDSYNAIKDTFNKELVPVSEFEKRKDVADYVRENGCYQTDGKRILLCGTKGELWDVKPEKFAQSYKTLSAEEIPSMKDGEWMEVSRAAEQKASAVGISIPTNYKGVYQTSWATLYVNNPNSDGHGKGDILVAPLLENGQPDYSHISPTNNEVFAMTYDQEVGGWCDSGLVINPSNIEKLTLDDVKKKYSIKSTEDILSKHESRVKQAEALCDFAAEESSMEYTV